MVLLCNTIGINKFASKQSTVDIPLSHLQRRREAECTQASASMIEQYDDRTVRVANDTFNVDRAHIIEKYAHYTSENSFSINGKSTLS